MRSIRLCNIFLTQQVTIADLKEVSILHLILGLVNELRLRFLGILRVFQHLPAVQLVVLRLLYLYSFLYLEFSLSYYINPIGRVSFVVNSGFPDEDVPLEVGRQLQQLAPG